MLADPTLDVAEEPDGVLVGRHVNLDRQVDVVHVDEALTERPRHRAVELHDHRAGGADGGVHGFDGHAERAEAVGIGRGRVDEDGIKGQYPAIEHVGHVGQEDRHVVGPALMNGGSRVGPDEQRPMTEMRRHPGRQMQTRSLRVQVDHPHVAQLGCPGHEGFQQD